MKAITRLRYIAFLSILTISLHAKDLGVWGQVYPISEPDILTFIHQRLGELEENGELAKMETKFKQNVVEHTLRPKPVEGVSTTQKPTTFYYDPTFTAPADIADGEGTVFVKAGTTVNPFDRIALKEVLLFINADDPDQIKWALQEKEEFDYVKIILVAGNIKIASTDDHLGRIYFDQEGRLCKKLKITEVPAFVTQDGKRLRIEEVPPSQIIRNIQAQSEIKS